MFDFTDSERERLRIFEDLLCLHNRRYNLVGGSTLGEVWERHILDSAQLVRFFPDRSVSILDIGSGAGFPGMVLGILGYDLVLLDRNRHKCDFLRIVSRAVGVDVDILRMDVGEYLRGGGDIGYDFVVVRAVSGLVGLLDLCWDFLEGGAVCLFMKGRGWEVEWGEVGEELRGKLQLEVFDSAVGDGVILKISL